MKHDDRFCDCELVHEEAAAKARGSLPSAALVDGLSAFFKILGDPTRIRIMCALDCAELCVCDLSAVLGMTKSAVFTPAEYAACSSAGQISPGR